MGGKGVNVLVGVGGNGTAVKVGVGDGTMCDGVGVGTGVFVGIGVNDGVTPGNNVAVFVGFGTVTAGTGVFVFGHAPVVAETVLLGLDSPFPLNAVT